MTKKLQKDALLEEVLHSKDPGSLVKTLSEEDVWLTIKKLGERNALPILASTSNEQLQYILDIELWKRDKFLPEQSLVWLEYLKECGTKKVLQWIYESDADCVILVFKEFVHVEKKESSEDNPLEREWPSEFPPVTFDGSYYFQCLTQRSDEIIRPVLELLAKDNHQFFMKLCEAVMAELRSNLEESAFSWRMKRLSDKGFAPLEEALEVYKYLNDRQIASLPKRAGFKPTDIERAAIYPLALGGESYPVLMIALADLKNDPLADDVKNELAVLANKVVMADARPITPETIESSLKKVMGYTNIGLESLSGADIHKAGKVLHERWVMHLFQIGYSLIARLRQHARKFMTSGWPNELGGDLSFLDEPIASRIAGILRKRPLYPTFDSPENPYREFKSIDEVREVKRNIEKAEYLGEMIKNVFKVDFGELKALTVERENLCFSNIILTAWAKGLATGLYKFSPLTERELKSALKKAWGKEVKESSIRSFKMETSAKFINWLIQHQPQISSNEEKFCRSFVNECFNKFLEEFAELQDMDQIDWRFIQSLWVVPEAD